MSADETCEHDGESGPHWFAVAGERADDIRACPGPTTDEIRARHAARIAHYRKRLMAEHASRLAVEAELGAMSRYADALVQRAMQAVAERNDAIVALHVALKHADGTLRGVDDEDRRLELSGCQDVLDRLASPDGPTPNPVAGEFVECDVRMDPAFGQLPHYCARRVGHRGPHSTDREPGPSSMTWRRAECPCARCDTARRANLLPERLCGFMIVCQDCGNKRCPRAAWHGNACTGSNESGQPGSNYP